MMYNGRVKDLNSRPATGGSYVMYWMQASQRTAYNHALDFAIHQANRMHLPLVVYFGLTDSFPEANQRHYSFMLEGLREVQEDLRHRSIQMIVRHEDPAEGAVTMARQAGMLVCDRGYLAIQRLWRQRASSQVDCSCIQVESDVVVPVEEVSGKEEYSAATIRPRIHRLLSLYLAAYPPSPEPRLSSMGLELNGLDIGDVGGVLDRLDIDRDVGEVDSYKGGYKQASGLLAAFLDGKLATYPVLRSDPNADALSDMSPYLHFGQISPLEIALKVAREGGPGVEEYLEELVVRRELAINFVYYNPQYASYEAVPGWARKSLAEHQRDRREYIYSLPELENAQTRDVYWNAAQREMLLTGKMHGYMRMYWGKKIIEWTRSPEEAFDRCRYLNNKYELDGRDASSYAGIAWCFGKHDRPWSRRPVFGSVRYMNARGLKRKFDADRYAARYA